jgi:hypothetical protein
MREELLKNRVEESPAGDFFGRLAERGAIHLLAID